MNSKPLTPFQVDLQKYYMIGSGTTTLPWKRKLRLFLFHFGLHCVGVYRLGQNADRLYAENKLLGFVPKVIHRVLNLYMELFHHVSIAADGIGPGFYIGHVGTIYIGPARIGSNFTLGHQVTIGVGFADGAEGLSTIGDNVYVGIGSVLSGAITIGDNVTISAGTMLSRSVPDGCLVAGNPGRVTLRDYDNRKLLGASVENGRVYPPLHAERKTASAQSPEVVDSGSKQS